MLFIKINSNHYAYGINNLNLYKIVNSEYKYNKNKYIEFISDKLASDKYIKIKNFGKYFNKIDFIINLNLVNSNISKKEFIDKYFIHCDKIFFYLDSNNHKKPYNYDGYVLREKSKINYISKYYDLLKKVNKSVERERILNYLLYNYNKETVIEDNIGYYMFKFRMKFYQDCFSGIYIAKEYN